MKPRFTTGELARLHGISKQTLIFYDKAGVFCPREIDPHNGYRYYAADQLELLDHILILKDMGLSLQEIRAFLALPQTSDTITALRHQQDVLRERETRLREAMARLSQKLLTLETLQDMQPGEITLVELPAQPLAVRSVEAPGDPVATDIALKALLREVRERHLPFEYQMGTRISPAALHAGTCTLAFEVFFPLRKSCRDRLCRTRPAGRYLRCIHSGPYAAIGETYGRMLEAAARRAFTLQGGSYETCLLDSMTARTPEAYLTEVLLPVGEFS